ncbi:MAG: class I SAM-dependent methyltransferase, partial [Acidimicrobiales bacterium]
MEGRMDAELIDQIKAVSAQVWGFKQGEGIGWMIAIGDRLGLFDAMAGAGPMSPTDLAAKTGLKELWVDNWLHGIAAAGLVEYFDDGPTFELAEPAAAVLANEETSPFFAAGVFGPGLSAEHLDAIADSFCTGVGMTYDGLGDAPLTCVERMTAPMIRAVLPDVIRRMKAVSDRLDAGGRVLDIGCGAGMSLVALAESFPACELVGLEPSELAVERA